METKDIFLTACILISYAVNTCLFIKYIRLVKDYQTYLEHNFEVTDAMTVYCLTDICHRMVEMERYEEAAKCRELINNIKQFSNASNKETKK